MGHLSLQGELFRFQRRQHQADFACTVNRVALNKAITREVFVNPGTVRQ